MKQSEKKGGTDNDSKKDINSNDIKIKIEKNILPFIW